MLRNVHVLILPTRQIVSLVTLFVLIYLCLLASSVLPSTSIKTYTSPSCILMVPIFLEKKNLCTYVNGQFDENSIHNRLEFFVDSDHVHAVTYCRSISCILFIFLGVTVHWKVCKWTCIATHSSDSEVIAFYIATKMADYLRHILEFIGVKFLEPIHGLEDIQLNIDII